MTNRQRFIEAVRQNRALTREQKALLLEDPNALSEGYREHITRYLATFDSRSMARERELREALEEEYQSLMRSLYAEEPDEHKRNEILGKARKQIDAFFLNVGV